MYVPRQFNEPRVEVLHELIREYPLATLVTTGPDGPDSNAVPFCLAAREDTPLGVLQGHVARANPLWQEHTPETPVLAIFHGPEIYIHPSWYITKAETGKVVPTWNYVVVQAKGHLRVIEDPQWIRAQMEALTCQQEAPFEHQWEVSDAPADFIERLIGAVVGIEIEITQLTGKWKVSQNQKMPNRRAVATGLEAMATDEAMAMARLVRERSEIHPD